MGKYCHRHKLAYESLCPQCQGEIEEIIKAFRDLYGEFIPPSCPNCHAELVETFTAARACALICPEHGQVWEDKTGLVRGVRKETA